MTSRRTDTGLGHARALLTRAEHWFERSRASLLQALPCQTGCSRCCTGLFAITTLDAEEMAAGLAQLDEHSRHEIQARAERQRAAVSTAFPQLADTPFVDDWSDAELDLAASRFADVPCPALGPDGRCRIYPSRPLTCRVMGIPIEQDGLVHGACSVQTAVPVIRLSRRLQQEHEELSQREAEQLEQRVLAQQAGEELWLPDGFLPDRWRGSADCPS